MANKSAFLLSHPVYSKTFVFTDKTPDSYIANQMKLEGWLFAIVTPSSENPGVFMLSLT